MSSDGTIMRYRCVNNSLIPPEEGNFVTRLADESAVTALQMDEKNEEGIFGTDMGNIFYINFQQEG